MELNELVGMTVLDEEGNAVGVVEEVRDGGGFEIDNDEKADWAVRKVLEAYEERDRLLSLIASERTRLIEKEANVNNECEGRTAYLLELLEEYMGTVKTRSTDTQETYKLLNGTLRYKKPRVDVSAGDGLTEWLEQNRPELLKVDKRPDWAAVKKLVKKVGDGCFILADSGEVVNGITEKETPGKLEVKA